MEIPEELQQYKSALNSFTEEELEAIIRKYGNASEKEEALAVVQQTQEYLTTTSDPLEQRVKQLRNWTDELFRKHL